MPGGGFKIDYIWCRFGLMKFTRLRPKVGATPLQYV